MILLETLHKEKERKYRGQVVPVFSRTYLLVPTIDILPKFGDQCCHNIISRFIVDRLPDELQRKYKTPLGHRVGVMLENDEVPKNEYRWNMCMSCGSVRMVKGAHEGTWLRPVGYRRVDEQ